MVECCSYWCNRREIQAKVYSGQRGTRTRMRSIYTQRCMFVRIRLNPRRACARVTVVVLCVCLCVPALAASASVETSNQRYPLVSLRILRIFEKNFHSKVMV